MAMLSQEAAESAGCQEPRSTGKNRSRWRFRFRVRALLILPLVVAAALLVAFPKLLSGDYADARITSISDNGTKVVIEIDARMSGGTRWMATNAMHGGSMGVSGNSTTHSTPLLPTWPTHTSITINLSFNRSRLRSDSDFEQDVLQVQQGETYRVTPHKPLDLVVAQYADGREGRCWFKVSRGSRLGL